MASEHELAFARRWVADHTDEYHHEGGERVLALLAQLERELVDCREGCAELTRVRIADHAEQLDQARADAWGEGYRNARF
ncbi:MAG TPA: hypothetical protein VK509_10420, partial [Polyangiales bacterium]|nr:hypothetical protein [Polyangiales bacterium]